MASPLTPPRLLALPGYCPTADGSVSQSGFYQQTRFLDLGASASRTDWRGKGMYQGLSWPPFHSKVKQVTEQVTEQVT